MRPHPTKLERLYAEYASLRQEDSGRLSSDQRRSLRYYLSEVAPGEAPGDSVRIATWTRNRAALERFVEGNGRMPRENRRSAGDSITEEERTLSAWMRTERRAMLSGRRCTFQVARLGCIPGLMLSPLDARWHAQAAAFERFTDTHGRAPRYRSDNEQERQLAQWAAKQRLAYREGRLAQRRAVGLSDLAFWTWG